MLVLGILRVVFWLLVLRLVLRFVAGVVRGYQGTPVARSKERARAAGTHDLVRDRVCNTFVPRERALTATLAGAVEYFCSPACRDRALAAAAGAA